jgi:Periplasmic protein involved in polysaccharide export
MEKYLIQVQPRYKKGEDITFYIESLGGFSEYADISNIFVLHPNGVSERIKRKNVFRDGLNSNQTIYPGSIIFIPRKTPNIFRSQSLQAYASILGNLGVSLASISVLKD